LRRAVELFEPRLSAVRVRPDVATQEESDGTLEFTIEAQLWGYPMSQQLELHTKIDTMNGISPSPKAPRPRAPVGATPWTRASSNTTTANCSSCARRAQSLRACIRVLRPSWLDELECADPYVERLLEGFAFLAARVQLKLDARHPQFTEQLMELVYPGLLSPVPSAAVVEITPDLEEGALKEGVLVPRGSSLKRRSPRVSGPVANSARPRM